MYIIQIPTDGLPYKLFVAKRPMLLSDKTRRPYDPNTKTWKTEAGAQRWLDARPEYGGVIVNRGD